MSEIATADHPRVVVGFDGTPASRAAVSLALHHVADGGRLVVVHAFKLPSGHYGEPQLQSSLDAGLARARHQLERLPEEVPGLAGVDWASELVGGSAANAILRVADAENATAIIIGTRGVGRARALGGSVAHAVLHSARCPVFVVPARAVAEPDSTAPAPT